MKRGFGSKKKLFNNGPELETKRLAPERGFSEIRNDLNLKPLDV